jgi:hypothetical protein
MHQPPHGVSAALTAVRSVRREVKQQRVLTGRVTPPTRCFPELCPAQAGRRADQVHLHPVASVGHDERLL